LISHGDVERFGLLILFPRQIHRRMFLCRIRAALTSGIAADSSDRRQGALDKRADLRKGSDQLFLLFLSPGSLVPAGESSFHLVPIINPPFADTAGSLYGFLINVLVQTH